MCTAPFRPVASWRGCARDPADVHVTALRHSWSAPVPKSAAFGNRVLFVVDRPRSAASSRWDDSFRTQLVPETTGCELPRVFAASSG